MMQFPLADWEPYRGCNHLRVPEPPFTWGGGISFAGHLGKPLSQALWEDLIGRCGVRSLWIITDYEWSLGRGSGSASVYLDDAGLVTDIYLVPYGAMKRTT